MASHSFESTFQKILNRQGQETAPYGSRKRQFLEILQAEDREWTIQEIADRMDCAYSLADSAYRRLREKKLILVRYVRVAGKGNYNQVRIRAKSVSEQTKAPRGANTERLSKPTTMQ
jgi:hypothetical protein